MLETSFFHLHGYQLIRNFLPKKQMVSVFEYLNQEKNKTLEKIYEFLPFDSEQDLIIKTAELTKDSERFNQLDPNLRQWLSGHYPLEVRLSSTLLNVLSNPQISVLYSQIFPGEDPKVHLPPVFRFVLPNNKFAGVPPHQDISYNKHIEDFFVMWTPLTSITEERGGVEIFPGTQALPEQLQNLERQFWLDGIKVDVDPIHFDMEIGDVLLLNPFIVHQSRANLSDEVRISGDFRFFSGASTKHYLNIATNEKIAPSVCAT